MMRFLGALIFCWIFACTGVNAAELGEATIRIDSQKIGESPLPLLVKVTTGRNVVENGLKITAGNGWQFSNPVITTDGLPAGVDIWPGIDITQVTTNYIVFNSNDLLPDRTYGFYIVSGVPNNPNTLVENDWIWKVETLINGTMDAERSVMVPLLRDDQIKITGKVGAKASDFQLSMTMAPGGIKKQNEVTEFTVNYGSYLLNWTKPMVLTASWSKGTIDGAPLATIDGLDYVIGSGTTAYGQVEPVIDVVNRKIVWTISSFPANTQDQQLKFSLKTNENYTGSSKVNYEINIELEGANVVTVSDTNYLVFQRVAAITPIPTSSSGGTVTTSAVSVIVLENILINKVLMKNGGIEVRTTVEPDSLTIKYGLTPKSLTKSITSLSKLKIDWFELNDLKPGENYYFKIEATKGKFKATSDLYTFITPTQEATTVVENNTLLVISDNLIITDMSAGGKAEIVLPKKKIYTVKVNLNNTNYKELNVIVRKETDSVLGLSTIYGAEPNSLQSEMVQASGKACTAVMITPKENGYYGIYLKIVEINGNITETKIANLRTVDPIIVVDENKQPVENATILISKYDENLKIYKNLPSSYKGFPNPGKTNTRGEFVAALVSGNYQVEVSAFNFKTTSVTFAIGLGKEEIMPKIRLTKANVSLWQKIENLNLIAGDVGKYSVEYLTGLMESGSFFDLVETGQMFISLLLVLMLISRLNGINWWMIPWWIGSFIRVRPLGKVIDELTKKRVPGAVVYINDVKIKTNKLGEFWYKLNNKKESYIFKILAMEYYGKTIEYSVDALNMGNITINLEKINNGNQTKKLFEKELFELLGGVVVIIFLIWQILFLYKLELVMVLPFLIIALINLIVWSLIVLKIERKNVV